MNNRAAAAAAAAWPPGRLPESTPHNGVNVSLGRCRQPTAARRGPRMRTKPLQVTQGRQPGCSENTGPDGAEVAVGGARKIQGQMALRWRSEEVGGGWAGGRRRDLGGHRRRMTGEAAGRGEGRGHRPRQSTQRSETDGSERTGEGERTMDGRGQRGDRTRKMDRPEGTLQKATHATKDRLGIASDDAACGENHTE